MMITFWVDLSTLLLETGSTFVKFQDCFLFSQNFFLLKSINFTNQYQQRGGTKAVLGTCPFFLPDSYLSVREQRRDYLSYIYMQLYQETVIYIVIRVNFWCNVISQSIMTHACFFQGYLAFWPKGGNCSLLKNDWGTHPKSTRVMDFPLRQKLHNV